MEGLRVFQDAELAKRPAGMSEVEYVLEDMKKAIEGMVHELFGKVEMRWVDAYFPFTDPSLELEIHYNGKWMEVLGCGVIQQKIMEAAGHGSKKGWAFGFGTSHMCPLSLSVTSRLRELMNLWYC
jgi:phenylalanyl-tRNA synthetase alpha chain